jgi:phage FluMu protein Com
MPDLKKIKCHNCKKTLLHADLTTATISKDCPKCGTRNLIMAENTIITIVSTKKEDVFNRLTREYISIYPQFTNQK